MSSFVANQRVRKPQDLQSPFAAADVQQSSCQPQDLDAVHSRKRARHMPPEADSFPQGQRQQLATHFKQTAPSMLGQSDPITIHRPTAQRPAAGAACSFGLQAFPSQPINGLHAFNAAAAAAPNYNPIQLPASCGFVPDSLATAAALANAVSMSKSQVADAARQYQQGAAQPETSADNRTLQRKQLSAHLRFCECRTASTTAYILII